jgi:hypothetical protein
MGVPSETQALCRAGAELVGEIQGVAPRISFQSQRLKREDRSRAPARSHRRIWNSAIAGALARAGWPWRDRLPGLRHLPHLRRKTENPARPDRGNGPRGNLPDLDACLTRRPASLVCRP